MKVQNLSHRNLKKVGTVSKNKITQLAKAFGFEQRNSKIKASSLVTSFIIMMSEGGKSYWDWASSLSIIIGKSVSKQALFGRMTKAWTDTVKALLQEVMNQQVQAQIKHKLFASFGNVWLQDSTSLHLPDILKKVFKGNVSKGVQKSVAKLNVVINVLSGSCPVLDWMSLTVNEQALSSSILNIAKAGDLVIRDLGYFVLDTFKQLNEEGIYFLSRLKYGVFLYDTQTERKIDIRQLLKNKIFVDQEVLFGKDTKLKFRLVAIKLSPEQTNERIRKAKKDRDKRLNHNPEYYELLGYIIFITNVDDKTWNYKQVADAYRVRWNIEILFKSWKSGFHIQNILPEARKHTQRVESILYLMLIYITWFQMLIYIPLRWDKALKNKQLSIIKTVKYITSQFINFITEPLSVKTKRKIFYYCCYDKRQDRLNAIELLEEFYNTLA